MDTAMQDNWKGYLTNIAYSNTKPTKQNKQSQSPSNFSRIRNIMHFPFTNTQSECSSKLQWFRNIPLNSFLQMENFYSKSPPALKEILIGHRRDF